MKLTARAGLTLVAACVEALGLPVAFETQLPAAGSERSYNPWELGRAILLMLSGGGQALDDLRELASDRRLREVIDPAVPSADAVGDWLNGKKYAEESECNFAYATDLSYSIK